MNGTNYTQIDNTDRQFNRSNPANQYREKSTKNQRFQYELMLERDLYPNGHVIIEEAKLKTTKYKQQSGKTSLTFHSLLIVISSFE